jgi:hypothetical protein
VNNLLGFIKKQIFFNSQLKKEEIEQLQDGYKVEMPKEGRGRYIVYAEKDYRVFIGVAFTNANNVTLFTQNLKMWDSPHEIPLSGLDRTRILRRVIKYLTVWGNVTLDDAPLEGLNDIKASLQAEEKLFDEYSDAVRFNVAIEKEHPADKA